jgi:hypothetical protein
MRQEFTAVPAPGQVRCVECDAPAVGPATGWQAFLCGGFEDNPVEVVIYCPACAAREVGLAATD